MRVPTPASRMLPSTPILFFTCPQNKLTDNTVLTLHSVKEAGFKPTNGRMSTNELDIFLLENNMEYVHRFITVVVLHVNSTKENIENISVFSLDSNHHLQHHTVPFRGSIFFEIYLHARSLLTCADEPTLQTSIMTTNSWLVTITQYKIGEYQWHGSVPIPNKTLILRNNITVNQIPIVIGHITDILCGAIYENSFIIFLEKSFMVKIPFRKYIDSVKHKKGKYSSELDAPYSVDKHKRFRKN